MDPKKLDAMTTEELVALRGQYHDRWADGGIKARAEFQNPDGSFKYEVGKTPAEVMNKARALADEATLYRHERDAIDREISARASVEKIGNGLSQGLNDVSTRAWDEFAGWLRNAENYNHRKFSMGAEMPTKINVAHQLRTMFPHLTKRADFIGTVDATTGGALVRPADAYSQLIQDIGRVTIFGASPHIPISGQTLDMYQFALNLTMTFMNEGDTITPATITNLTGKETLVVKDYSVAAYIHENALADWLFPAEALVLSRFARAHTYHQDDMALNGDGNNEPTGILNTSGISAIDQIDKDFLSPEDVKKLPMKLEKQYRQLGGIYIMHRNTLAELLLIRDDSGGAGTGRFMLEPDFTMGMPSRINGFAFAETEFMTDPVDKASSGLAATDCRILFGALSNYLFAEKQGLEIAVSPHYKFLDRMVTYRGVSRYDGSVILKAGWVRLNKGALN